MQHFEQLSTGKVRGSDGGSNFEAKLFHLPLITTPQDLVLGAGGSSLLFGRRIAKYKLSLLSNPLETHREEFK